MNIIQADRGRVLVLGRRGENLHTQVQFNLSKWKEEYPNALVSLTVEAPGQNVKYPAAETDDLGTVYIWDITASETAAVGHGRCELIARENNVIVKSEIWRTQVLEALDDPDGEPPEPWDSWQEAFGSFAAETRQNAQNAAESASLADTYADNAETSKVVAEGAAEDALRYAIRAEEAVDSYNAITAAAETLPDDSDATAEMDHSGQTPVLRLGIPRGARGAKGEPGDPTELIDDTAGAGDTNKVWSANKLAPVAEDVSDLKSALNALGLSVVDGAINITFEEASA